MKKFSLTTLLIIITLGFSSCTQDDNTLLEEPTAEDLLKSFNLNKSTNGDFSLDYQLGKNAASDNVRDDKTNTNNIYLYSSEGAQRSSSNQDLTIQNGELKVSFNDTEKDTKHTITVLDDDIKMRGEHNEYLKSYAFSGNGDGSYDLNFTVIEGVVVDFIYNDDTKVYEIHLKGEESASQSEFIQTFTKQEGLALEIQFFDNSDVNNAAGRSTEPKEPNPVIIAEDDPELD